MSSSKIYKGCAGIKRGYKHLPNPELKNYYVLIFEKETNDNDIEKEENSNNKENGLNYGTEDVITNDNLIKENTQNKSGLVNRKCPVCHQMVPAYISVCPGCGEIVEYKYKK